MNKTKDFSLPVVAMPKYDPDASLAHAGEFNIIRMVVDFVPVELKRKQQELAAIDAQREKILIEMEQLRRLSKAVADELVIDRSGY